MRKKRERKKKQDTKLESVGAEFLVLGHLLIEKISAHKTYSNFPGYDLIAINPNAVTPKKNKVASRILYFTN